MWPDLLVGHIGRTRDVSVLTSWMFLFVGLFSLAVTCAFEPRVPAEQWTPVLMGKLIFGFALIFLSIVLSETHFRFLRKFFKKS